jgi:hypothetical protein
MPNEKTGYCTDDNCRAFLVTVNAYRHNPDPEILRLMGLYLSFLRAARNDRGKFRNFMSFHQFFLDDEGSEDCQGRTLWSLGYALRHSMNATLRAVVEDLFEPAFTWLPELRAVRGQAYSIIGLRHYHRAKPDDPRAAETTRLLGEAMADSWERYATERWPWWEGRLTYANAIPPMAMLLAHDVTGVERFRDIGLRSLDWLTTVTVRDGVLVPIGSNGWYQRGRKRNEWDQQAIEAAGMVGAYLSAWRATNDRGYLDLARTAFEWFHGRNLLGASMLDPITGGVYDGLSEHGPNQNEGAESLLVYALAYMAYLRDGLVLL